MADQYMDDASIALVRAANLPISLAAVEEIIREEDSSEFYYKAHYQRPEWPGGGSGVTIALGYDLGMSTGAVIHDDWIGKVSPDTLVAMMGCAGISGERAHGKMLEVRQRISISWEAALDVFLHRDMPKWIATVRKYLPNTDRLSPDSLGALVSLVYNRGPSFDRAGDHYREMRAIKMDMAAEHFDDIPAQFRSMARLWTGGVHDRRLREAALFGSGLSDPPVRGSVLWAQRSLNLLGGDRIDEDGDIGPQTVTKIKAFQVARGLPATGTIDENLCCAIDLAVAEKKQPAA